LAARLFIEIRSSSNLPATLPDQAAWWAANYNLSQPAQQFEALVSSYEKASGMTPVGSLKQSYTINSMPTKCQQNCLFSDKKTPNLILVLCHFLFLNSESSGKCSLLI